MRASVVVESQGRGVKARGATEATSGRPTRTRRATALSGVEGEHARWDPKGGDLCL